MVWSRRSPIRARSGSPTACMASRGWSITPRSPGATAAGRRPPLSSALIYELHLGTFTPEGTLKAAESRLDYLKDLGVTHVELMPIANFPGKRGWGYDGVDLYAPFNAYGEPDDLKHFVNACHGKGLAVLLDVVYNHLGPVGNYLRKFGPYFTDQPLHALGRRGQFRRSRRDRSSPLPDRQCVDVAARLPHGRIAPGRGARIQ